jgi:hypothetical protein
MGECRYSSTILELGNRWRKVVSFMPQPLYHRGKSLRCPLARRLGPVAGLDAVKERNMLPYMESKGPPRSWPVVITTELSQLNK